MIVSRREFVLSAAAVCGAKSFALANTESYALVLGSAQDGGLPQAGCYTPRCNRARGAPQYVASIALIEPEAERFFLVDASPDIARQMDLITEEGFRDRAQQRRPFDGIFLTHAHIGHYLGLALLGREGLGMSPVPCYCSPKMAAYLSANGPWSLLVREGRLFFPELPMDKWHSLDETISVRMLPVPHRQEYSDTVAFIFRGPTRSLLYLPDIDSWDAWDRSIQDVVASIDVALLDGAFYSASEVPGRRVEDIPHPLIPDTMRRLEKQVAGGKQIFFTHLNNTNPAFDDDSREYADVRARGFDRARAGQRIAL